MSLDKTLKLKGMDVRYPIVQGGMGIGVSLYPLGVPVGRKGGIPTLSSAALDHLTRRRILALGEEVADVHPGKMDYVEAVRREVADTVRDAGVCAINIMCAVPLYYEKAVQGAIQGGVNMIVSGAGLPLNLPSQVKKITGTNDHNINLIPIVSSGRALEIICKRWERQGYRPDAVVLEGPKAGGHLGWNYKQIEQSTDFLQEYDLINKLLPEVHDVVRRYPGDSGLIPIIVAGGVYNHQDILHALYNGASAVQMGTRFAITEESGFTLHAKNTVIEAGKEDIIIADRLWGSPCKFPFRYVATSPLANHKGESEYFCVCTGLLSSAGIDNTGKKGYPPRCPEKYVKLTPTSTCPAVNTSDYSNLITIGSEGYRINEIVSAETLMDELIG